jgi:protein-disulfide isomerase
VEFTDLECPFCRRFGSETFNELKRRYIDTGSLRFVTKDFPLESHAHAKLAAVASRCAGEQGQFWKFRTALIQQQAPLSGAAIDAAAAGLGLDVERFSRCLLSPRHAAEVDRDVADGRRIGVSGTPTFFLGRTTSETFRGTKIVGAQELSVFEKHMGAFATP